MGKINVCDIKLFIKKGELKFPKMFDYSNFNYDGQSNKSMLKCKKHNLEFEVTPKQFLRADNSCPECRSNNKKSLEFEKFKLKICDLFDGKITFDEKSKYVNEKTNIHMICGTHGEFSRRPSAMFDGVHGCQECGHDVSKSLHMTIDDFVFESRHVHGDLYGYDDVVFFGMTTKIDIMCNACNIPFSQMPYDHVAGHGCKKCGNIRHGKKATSNLRQFSDKAVSLYNDRFSYDKFVYVTRLVEGSIRCIEHNEYFNQTPDRHLRGKCVGCKKCSNSLSSSSEIEIRDYIASIYDGEISSSNRKMIAPFEIDIYLPELKIGIEYNGVHWHSEKFADNNYHFNKRKLCESVSVRLISIWEDEWIHHQQKVKDYLSNIVSKPYYRHYARKLEIKPITIQQQRQFLTHNHFQKYVNSTVCLGLHDKSTGELIQLMSIKKKNGRLYEIGRLCTKRNHVVIGGSEKLFKHLKIEIDGLWDTIISYNYLDKFTGEVYKKLGMSHVNDTKGFFFIKGTMRFHRLSIESNYMKECGKSEFGITQEKMVTKLGWWRCYTSGTSKWELRNINQ